MELFEDGGLAANVIPAYASMEYYFRAPTMAYCKEIAARAEDCVKGSCIASQTTYKTSMYECPYEDTKINYTLADMLTEKYKELGVEQINPVDEIPCGSTDVGSVSYVCPTIQERLRLPIVRWLVTSKEMAAATISEDGKTGLVTAATAIALIGLDLITEPEKLEKAKKEFEKGHAN